MRPKLVPVCLLVFLMLLILVVGLGADYDDEASLGPAPSFATASAVEVSDSATTVLSFRTYGRGADVCMEVLNAGGTNALASLEIEIQARSGGAWINYLADTDWQDGGNTNVFFSNSDDDATAVQDLAAGHAGIVQFRCRPSYAFRIRAAATTGNATNVAVYGTAARW